MRQSMRPVITTWGTPTPMPFGTMGTREVLEALCDEFEVSYVAGPDDIDLTEFIITDGVDFLEKIEGADVDEISGKLDDEYLLNEARGHFINANAIEPWDSEPNFRLELVTFIQELQRMAEFWDDELDDGELRLGLD